MKYDGEKNYKHGSKERIGVLITNLGTPDRPDKMALELYLKEFLSDPRVIELPKIIWQIILRGIILNIRPKKVAELYKSIWGKEGGPLLVMLKKQKKGIEKNLRNKIKNIKFGIAMRYGNPNISTGLKKLRNLGCRRILILPLYPQLAPPSNSPIRSLATFSKYPLFRKASKGLGCKPISLRTCDNNGRTSIANAS